MKGICTTILIIWGSMFALAQNPTQRPTGAGNAGQPMARDEATGAASEIEHHVKNWQLRDLGSIADTVPVDTLTSGFQIHNPAFRQSIINVQLGNIGGPTSPALLSGQPVRPGFIFTRNLQYFFPSPETWKFYNTRTPYTNLYYQYAGPRQRSEEVLKVLFTQNVNRYWNVGFEYGLISSIGRYDAQRVENRNFRFFSSYSGLTYQIHGGYAFNRTDQSESGGIADDNFILNPQDYNFEREESIPVNFNTASTRIDNHNLFINQALELGNINFTQKEGETLTLPVATLNHGFNLSRYRRRYEIDNLATYLGGGNFFYSNIHIDSTTTNDLMYHTLLSNTFQLRFNEEANPLLRFGLRAFITNDIEVYEFPLPASGLNDATLPVIQLHGDSTISSTHVGGQIFKNRGENFRWNAGARFFFQGYRSGDSELTGALNSSFRIAKDTAGIFAKGGLYLNSPTFLEERFVSNHFRWDERFNPVKTLRARGGIAIPTRNFEITLESRLINDYVYWNREALPVQADHYISVSELRLFKGFNLGNFHNHNTAFYQVSSHPAVKPLPEWALYSSLFYENKLFGVLTVQLGFDLRYTTLWYAPAYMPATGQFHLQNERKIGDYPFIDLFLNMQIERTRFFIKMDHVTMGYMGNNYFHAINYPANPRGLKFGLSWNFYD